MERGENMFSPLSIILNQDMFQVTDIFFTCTETWFGIFPNLGRSKRVCVCMDV